MLSENEEYINELSLSWFEVYKKSISTYIILTILNKESMWSKQIKGSISKLSYNKLDMDDKSLYRALRRLEKQGLITHSTEKGQKTGLSRNIYSISGDGRLFLKKIREDYLINLI